MFLLPMMKQLFNQMMEENQVGDLKMNNFYEGRTIHVSDFLTDTIGRLKINEEEVDDTIPSEACVIINPEKNFDGWWNVDQLIDQVFYYNN